MRKIKLIKKSKHKHCPCKVFKEDKHDMKEAAERTSLWSDEGFEKD